MLSLTMLGIRLPSEKKVNARMEQVAGSKRKRRANNASVKPEILYCFTYRNSKAKISNLLQLSLDTLHGSRNVFYSALLFLHHCLNPAKVFNAENLFFWPWNKPFFPFSLA